MHLLCTYVYQYVYVFVYVDAGTRVNECVTRAIN